MTAYLPDYGSDTKNKRLSVEIKTKTNLTDI